MQMGHLYNQSVLIESDWNLKITYLRQKYLLLYVLIESDWNLKRQTGGCILISACLVLIESDWNLKLADMLGDMIGGRCINGIRLEFKSYLLEKDMKSE